MGQPVYESRHFLGFFSRLPVIELEEVDDDGSLSCSSLACFPFGSHFALVSYSIWLFYEGSKTVARRRSPGSPAEKTAAGGVSTYIKRVLLSRSLLLSCSCPPFTPASNFLASISAYSIVMALL